VVNITVAIRMALTESVTGGSLMYLVERDGLDTHEMTQIYSSSINRSRTWIAITIGVSCTFQMITHHIGIQVLVTKVDNRLVIM